MTTPPIRCTIPVYTLLLALAAPGVAHAAPPSPDETVAKAKASPLFRRALKRKDLEKARLTRITPSPGVTMDFRRYVAATSLTKRPELAPLLDPKLRKTYLDGAPTYTETILELRDRLVIDRKLTVPLAPGACAKPAAPKSIKELCFAQRPKGKPHKALVKELAALRRKLARQPAKRIVAGTTTVAEAKKMNDRQLLELLLNGEGRTIRHVSIVPRTATVPGVLTPGTRTFDKAAVVKTPTSGLVKAPTGPQKPGATVGVFDGPPQDFETDYFLTGFTLGKEIDDTWEYTLAESSWWHGRYYVRVDYHLGLGFGLRAPFSVDVEHASGGTNKRAVELKVAPVDVDENGKPAYSAVGLPKSKTFGGREFVLEFKASCHLKVSIPGPDVDKSCPTIDKGYSRDIDPVIGSETSKIKDWWLEEDVTGLGVDVGVAEASLDVGLGADVTKGRIGVRATPLSSSRIAGTAADMWFDSRNPKAFTVERTAKVTTAGFKLDTPRYAFDIRVQPKLRAQVGIDVGIYDKEWTLGPWALDFLSISHRFSLSHHAGTVAEHRYELFHNTGGPKAQLPKAQAPTGDKVSNDPAPTKLPRPVGKAKVIP